MVMLWDHPESALNVEYCAILSKTFVREISVVLRQCGNLLFWMICWADVLLSFLSHFLFCSLLLSLAFGRCLFLGWRNRVRSRGAQDWRGHVEGWHLIIVFTWVRLPNTEEMWIVQAARSRIWAWMISRHLIVHSVLLWHTACTQGTFLLFTRMHWPQVLVLFVLQHQSAAWPEED